MSKLGLKKEPSVEKQTQKIRNIVFGWDTTKEEIEKQAAVCKHRNDVLLSIKYFKNKSVKILEAGCGHGGIVKYLYDIGYKNVAGLEISDSSVDFLNQAYPELDVKQGDIRKMPYEKESFDVVLSYGVIEHFYEGPQVPMKAMCQ